MELNSLSPSHILLQLLRQVLRFGHEFSDPLSLHGETDAGICVKIVTPSGKNYLSNPMNGERATDLDQIIPQMFGVDGAGRTYLRVGYVGRLDSQPYFPASSEPATEGIGERRSHHIEDALRMAIGTDSATNLPCLVLIDVDSEEL